MYITLYGYVRLTRYIISNYEIRAKYILKMRRLILWTKNNVLMENNYNSKIFKCLSKCVYETLFKRI